MCSNDRRARPAPGFTLIELLVVIGIIGVLSAVLLPVLRTAMQAGGSAACKSNLRQMQLAYQMYLDDHGGRFFPYQQDDAGGRTLWYWGLGEQGPEGTRAIDKTKARLAPYFPQVGRVEICPSLPYKAPYFKRKFDIASYGYGLNAYLLSDLPQAKKCGVFLADQIRNPCDTITWADAIQVNTWQAPASAQNPMLEEWYYLDKNDPPKFHFRHNGLCNCAFADGSVRSFKPNRLDQRCDGLSGYIEPPGEDYYLRTIK